MFESSWKRERPGAKRIAVVAVLAAVGLAAQAAVLAGAVGAPLARALAGVQALPGHAQGRDALPEVTEEIVVVAPHRRAQAATHPVTATAAQARCEPCPL